MVDQKATDVWRASCQKNNDGTNEGLDGTNTPGGADLGYVLSYVGDLPSGAAYYVAVRAYNDAGMGGFSRIVSVVVP